MHFVYVGTPQRKGEYAANMTYVDSAFAELAGYLHDGDIVVGKSTVPVGTAARLAEAVAAKAPEPYRPGIPSACATGMPWPTP